MDGKSGGTGWIKVGAGALGALLVVSAMGWVPLGGLTPAQGGQGPGPVAVTPPPTPPVTIVVNPTPTPTPTPTPVSPTPTPIQQLLTGVTGSHGPLAMTVHVSHERPWIQEGSVWVRCGLTVGEPADLPAREPVRLVLVLDVSGSMAGSMDLLKEATRGVARRLSGQDRLEILTYSNDAKLVFAGNPVEDLAALEAAVARLETEGGTNLGAGIELAGQLLGGRRGRGCDEPSPRFTQLPRVLVLTDGHANQGITTPEGLSELVRGLRARGAPVSCLGLGQSYNEVLLGQLADVGGGRYHYVDQMQALERVYAAELDQARRTVAQEAKLRLVPAPGVRVAEVVSWGWSREGEGALVDLGALSAGRELKVLARLELVGAEARRIGATVDVAAASLQWTAPAGRSLTSGSLALPAVQVSPVATAAEVALVPAMADDLRQLEIAREVAKATEEARRGEGDEAKKRILGLRQRLGKDELDYEAADGTRRQLSLEGLAADMAAPGAESERAAKAGHAFGQAAAR